MILNDLGASQHGGAERLTLSLRQGLRERGHDARVFASSAHSDTGPNEADYVCFGTTSGLRTLNRVVNPSAVASLRRVLRDFRPDLVHVRMFLTQLSPAILPLLRDVPALYHATWYEAICPTGIKLLPNGSICRTQAGVVCLTGGCLSMRAWGPLMLQMRLWRRWRDAFDLVVSNSDSLRERLLEAGIAPIETVWNGVPEVPARPKLDGPPTVTCASRLAAEKGIDVLVRAFVDVVRALPDARLLIAGSGPEASALNRLISKLGLTANVDLVGHSAHEGMEALLARGWAHAVPSLCAEGFGLSAAEAQMRGTAVVGANHGGVAEIVVDGDTGYLVAPGDAGALSAALLKLLRDRDRAENMGRLARERAKGLLGRGAWLDRFEEIYRRLGSGGYRT